MIIETLIPGRTEPIRAPPPTFREPPQVVFVQELAILAHDTQSSQVMLADRQDFLSITWVRRDGWGWLKVGPAGCGMA